MNIRESVEYIQTRDQRHDDRRLVVVLGSGWGGVVSSLMEIEGDADYKDIPGFPGSTVEGHQGRLLWGNFAGVPAYCMQGRIHYYEGYSMQQVTFPVRIFAAMGIQAIFLTNAAGGLNPAFEVGELMLIRDHINFMGTNPLIGKNLEEFGPRFPDMTRSWDAELGAVLSSCARSVGIKLHSGIYLAVSGPSFETPAEISAFAKLGADAVGMSTVPECIVARHSGMRVFGLSCITNMAAYVGGKALSHEDVASAALKSQKDVIKLLKRAIPELHQNF